MKQTSHDIVDGAGTGGQILEHLAKVETFSRAGLTQENQTLVSSSGDHSSVDKLSHGEYVRRHLLLASTFLQDCHCLVAVGTGGVGRVYHEQVVATESVEQFVAAVSTSQHMQNTGLIQIPQFANVINRV